jgi:hypothetical protein
MSPSNLPDLAPPTYLSPPRIPLILSISIRSIQLSKALSNVLLFIFDELPSSAAVATCNAQSRELCPCFDVDRDGHYRHAVGHSVIDRDGHYRHAVGHSVIQHAASSDSDAAASLQHD